MAKKKKEHGILPVDHSEKIQVRVECDQCNRYEHVFEYEKAIEARKFHHSFQECPSCRKLWCEICLPEKKCPVCGKQTIEIKPADIFICHYCMAEWGDKGGLCEKDCKYHKD